MTPRPAIMSIEDELIWTRKQRDDWHSMYKQTDNELAALRAENAALAERLRQQSEPLEMRGLIMELRWIHGAIPSFGGGQAKDALAAVLQRIDREPNQGTQTTEDTP